MEKRRLTHNVICNASQVYLFASEDVLYQLDLFLSNTDLTKDQQKDLMGIIELIFEEGVSHGIDGTVDDMLE